MNKLVYTPFKKAVVVILINDDGEICIVSRKDDHENFGLIGGKVDHEDSLHPTMDETMVAQTEADKLRSRRGRAAAILAGDQGGAVTTGTQKLLGY